MKSTKKCILFTSSAIGAIIAFVSASVALCLFEEKADFCYFMKKKAKNAIKHVEDKFDEKLC